MQSIFWFRNDLRLSDNPALLRALEKSDKVLPIFIMEDRWFQSVKPGFERMGKFRKRFLADTIVQLRADIEALGAQLLVLDGKAVNLIPRLVAQLDISQVYATKSFTQEEMDEESELEKQLFRLKCGLQLIHSESLIHPEDLPFPIHALPEVFTRFRKEVEPLTYIRKPLPKPNFIAAIVPGKYPESERLTSIDLQEKTTFSGGEKAGLERLHYYIWQTRLIATYKETRNGLLGMDYSSKFSPWLALGSLSPRTIFFEIKDFEKRIAANESTYWLVFELLWRDYFRFLSKKYGSKIFQINGWKKETGLWNQDEKRFWLWAQGKTGNPFIDANIREMNETGFMSNRGRQNVASFLAKDLKTDWRWGARYFESQLVDYDCSSNWGNWTYVAGVGNDPRENRYFNTWKQASVYDPEAAYIRKWLPQLAHLPKMHFHKPEGMTKKFLLENGQKNIENYPEPLVFEPVSA